MTYLTEQQTRDPRGVAMTLAIHGAMAAAILLYPAMQVIRHADKRVVAFEIPDPTPPEPDPEPARADPRQSIETVTDPVVTIPRNDPPPKTPDAAIDLGFTATAGGTGIDETGVKPIDLPPIPPVIVGARRDPRFARAFQPDYPSGLIRQELEGMVRVRVLVATDGRVKRVEAIDFDHPDFLRATERQALKYWRFAPATRDGVAVESWITQTVRFTLNQ